jgi:hypothetical protein
MKFEAVQQRMSRKTCAFGKLRIARSPRTSINRGGETY